MSARSTLLTTSLLAFALFAASSALSASTFVRGDFNNDGQYDIADPVATLAYLFLATGQPPCLVAGDSNDDETVDLSDSLFSLGYLFLGSGAPSAPFPQCGDDPTPGDLSCDRSRCIATVPMIHEALNDCGARVVDDPPNSLRPGSAMHKVTVEDSTAICNDGSPAVFYVRPAAAGSPNADRWIIYLQGGGACNSYESCRDRWCPVDNYDPSKMSSRFVPETIAGTGIMKRNEDNAFGDYNHVYVYYCSSDGWSGTRSHVVLESEESSGESMRLHFRGHDILDSVVQLLLPGGLVSDDQRVSMPALADAEFAMLSGFSAGAGGVLKNGDWFANQLTPNGTTVRLVRDSDFDVAVDLIENETVRSEVRTRLDAELQRRWDNSPWGPFVDQSALRYFEALGEEWRAFDSSRVTLDFVTTPFFVRADLFDRTKTQRWGDLGFSPQWVGEQVKIAMENLANVPSDAIQGEFMTRVPGALATTCRDHTGLMNDSVFFNRTVESAEGTPRSYHDTLLRWLSGTDVSLVDDPENPTSICGPEQPQDE